MTDVIYYYYICLQTNKIKQREKIKKIRSPNQNKKK